MCIAIGVRETRERDIESRDRRMRLSPSGVNSASSFGTTVVGSSVYSINGDFAGEGGNLNADEAKPLVGGVHRLTDLAGPDGIIRDLSATDVTFLGPAVMVVDGGVALDSPTADGTAESLLWEIDEHRFSVMGAIKFVNSRLVRCKFEGIGFAAKGQSFSTLVQSMKVPEQTQESTATHRPHLSDGFEQRNGEWYTKGVSPGRPGPAARPLRVDPKTGELLLVVEPGGPAEIGTYRTTTFPPNLHVDGNGQLFHISDVG